MKRFALVLALIALFGGIAGAQTFDELKGALSDIATGGAKTIGVNAAIGNTWSDAFIGSFPHLGAGVFVGATGTGMTPNIKNFMTQMGASLPPQLDALGFPIPALGAMAKIGLPFLPIDVGVKVGMIPPQLQSMIPGNFEVDYRNLGISLRAALV
ncbi:MAG: hypothetical protein JNG85_10075, partial [Spirochaetaceae bacterium]|nr:hypothetical protein [Spirochaetaceae bacterium]